MEVLLLILGFNVISIRAKHKQREREDAVAAFNDRHVLKDNQNPPTRGDGEEKFNAETEYLRVLDRIQQFNPSNLRPKGNYTWEQDNWKRRIKETFVWWVVFLNHKERSELDKFV